MNMPDYDLQMGEAGCSVLFPLPTEMIENIRRVGMSRIVAGTRYSPVRAFGCDFVLELDLVGSSWGGLLVSVRLYDWGYVSASGAT